MSLLEAIQLRRRMKSSRLGRVGPPGGLLGGGRNLQAGGPGARTPARRREGARYFACVNRIQNL